VDNKGTFHGYDINFKADITQKSLQQRIKFLSESFLPSSGKPIEDINKISR